MQTKKNFLQIIGDVRKRKYPLNYKFVEIKEMPESIKNRRFISIDLFQTGKYESFPYHKPISKLPL